MAFFSYSAIPISGLSEPCKLDRNRNGEEVLIYIRESTLS